jgi:CheY-like chemotaxis protein
MSIYTVSDIWEFDRGREFHLAPAQANADGAMSSVATLQSVLNAIEELHATPLKQDKETTVDAWNRVKGQVQEIFVDQRYRFHGNEITTLNSRIQKLIQERTTGFSVFEATACSLVADYCDIGDRFKLHKFAESLSHEAASGVDASISKTLDSEEYRQQIDAFEKKLEELAAKEYPDQQLPISINQIGSHGRYLNTIEHIYDIFFTMRDTLNSPEAKPWLDALLRSVLRFPRYSEKSDQLINFRHELKSLCHKEYDPACLFGIYMVQKNLKAIEVLIILEAHKISFFVPTEYLTAYLKEQDNPLSLKVVDLLLAYNVGLVNQDGRSILSLKAGEGNIQAVQYLLSKQLDVNMPDSDGSTALHAAAASGQSAMVRYLIEEGKAEIDAQDQSGKKAVAIAANQECRDYLQSIYQSEGYRKKQIEKFTKKITENRITQIEEISIHHLCYLILYWGADVFEGSKEGQIWLDEMIKVVKQRPNEKYPEFSFMLAGIFTSSLSTGKAKIIELLLLAGVSYDVGLLNGDYPLAVAERAMSISKNKAPYLAIIELLKAHNMARTD